MDNSKATTGGDGLPRHDQNSPLTEKLKAVSDSDATEHLSKANSWAQITADNTHGMPFLHHDGDKLKEKLPHLELLCYELAAQRLIDAICDTSKKLTGHDLFGPPGPHIARIFRQMSEFTGQIKSIDVDHEKRTAVVHQPLAESKSGEAHSPGAASPLKALDHAPVLVSAQKVEGSTGSTVGAKVAGDAPVLTAAAKVAGDAPVLTAVAKAAGDVPVLTAATKAAGDVPILTAAAKAAGDAPVLTAAAKAAGDAPVLTAAAKAAGDVPILTAAAKTESAALPANRGDSGVVTAIPAASFASLATVDSGKTLQASVNPFQSLKQVILREDAVLDAAGRTIANQLTFSQTPAFANRVTGEGNITLTHANEGNPNLVAAVKAEPNVTVASRTEIKQTPGLPLVSTPGSNRVEPTVSPAVIANPFQTVTQVSVRDANVNLGDVQSTAPVVSVSQLLVKEPISRAETLNHTQPTINQNPVSERVSSEAPTLVKNQEAAPLMVAAVRLDGVTSQPHRAEIPQPQSTVGQQSIVPATRVESVAQPTSANPFQNVKQVAVRQESVVDSSGRVVVKDEVVSAPVATPVAANPVVANSGVVGSARAVSDGNTLLARSSSSDSVDNVNRPPVLVANQLLVKEPPARLESTIPAQTTTYQNAKGDSSIPVQAAPSVKNENQPVVFVAEKGGMAAPVVRAENQPVLVPAVKVEGQSAPINQVARVEGQPVLVPAVKVEGQTAPINQVARVEGQPVLVPAVKVEGQTAPINQVARVEGQPVLVPAVKVEGQNTPMNQVARVEGQPVLVPAARVESTVATVVRAENQPVAGEVAKAAAPSPTPIVLAARSENQPNQLPGTKVESQSPATSAPVAGNPFQNVAQVAVKENAIVDGGGKTIVSEPVVSVAPVYVARVASDTNPVVRPLVADTGESGRAPVISASQIIVREPAIPAQNVNVATRPDAVSPVVLPPRVEAATTPAAQNSSEPTKPQPAPGNPFLSHNQVLAREDSLSDPVSKRVIAENISQYTPPPITAGTPRPQPVNPGAEAIVVRAGTEVVRDNTLARSSTPVVVASQLVVKEPGASIKTDSSSRIEQQARPVTLVKAEPMPKPEQSIRGSESNKIETPAAPGQPVAKVEALAAPGQPVAKVEAPPAPGQSSGKDEALVASAAPGTVLPAPGNALSTVSKPAEKLAASDTAASAGTLEGLFEAVGRSKLLAAGTVAVDKAAVATDLTGNKSNSDTGPINARQFTLGVHTPASRVANIELQIVDAKGGQNIASPDVSTAVGSVLAPGTAHALPVKSEVVAVKAESQSLVLDGKTTVRAGLKDNEIAIPGTTVIGATARNNAGSGGTATVSGSKAGAGGSTGATAGAGGVIVSNTTASAGGVAGATNANSTPTASSGLPGAHVSNATVPTSSSGATAGGANASGATVTGKGGAATASGVAGGVGGVAGGGAAGDPAGVNVSATTVTASADPAGVIVSSDPVSGPVPNVATVDPLTLQPLTLVDGEEVIDGRLKGEHAGASVTGKKVKAGENGKEPDSNTGDKEHGKAHNHNTRVRPQAADLTLSLEEMERRQRAEAERRKKLQEKARKPKAQPPKQAEKQRRCHILKGDTLESLALQYLGASNLATLIYRINQGFWWERRHANKVYLELLPGTVIFLPTTTEIVQFRENLTKGKVKLLHFEYLSCEHVRSLRQLLANARAQNGTAKPQTQDQGQFETIAQEDVTASLPVDATATVALAPVQGTFVAVAARCDKVPTALTAPFVAHQTGRLLVPGQTVLSERLEENSRVVEINAQGQAAGNHCQVQLQVWYSGQWLMVMEYVISDEPTLNVYSLAGVKREIKILLPASAVKSMALNDLTSNRLEYGRRFLLGRKILV